MILMLEPGTGEALEIPATFITFHEEEIIIYSDAALAADFYYEWKRENNRPLDINKCVAYKIPVTARIKYTVFAHLNDTLKWKLDYNQYPLT
jgi:hypothetical protein